MLYFQTTAAEHNNGLLHVYCGVVLNSVLLTLYNNTCTQRLFVVPRRSSQGFVKSDEPQEEAARP